MIDEQVILTAERLRDDLAGFKLTLRKRYSSPSRQVTAVDLQKEAARLAEKWLIEVANDQSVILSLGEATLADLNVHFQRMLTFSEHATTRSRYDSELRDILDDFSVRVILPLKQSRGRAAPIPRAADTRNLNLSAFIGQSFAPDDKRVNQCVFDVLTSIGVAVITGERPRAERISEKVKKLIEQQSIFVGVFTKRDKIARKVEWTTSPWVIDEKAYALGLRKPLILLKENGVASVGGIQGDYEYIEFSRDALDQLTLRLIQLFVLKNEGLAK